VAYFLAVTVEVHFPENGSLKGKRKELLSLKAGVARRFGAAVAEVDHQDLWQRTTLALGLVGSSARELERSGAALERWLDARFPQGVRVEQRLVSFEDLGEI
jgi:uncharacterized protein YlxP (DUF503 family)